MAACNIAAVVAVRSTATRAIAETLASIDRQTLLPAERVLICSQASAPVRVGDGWRVVETQDTDLAAAYNAGIEVSSSPWLTFLDSDRVLVPDYIEAMKRAVDAAGTEIGIIYPDI